MTLLQEWVALARLKSRIERITAYHAKGAFLPDLVQSVPASQTRELSPLSRLRSALGALGRLCPAEDPPRDLAVDLLLQPARLPEPLRPVQVVRRGRHPGARQRHSLQFANEDVQSPTVFCRSDAGRKALLGGRKQGPGPLQNTSHEVAQRFLFAERFPVEGWVTVS